MRINCRFLSRKYAESAVYNYVILNNFQLGAGQDKAPASLILEIMSLSLVAYDDSSDSETEENQPSGPNINLDKQSDSKSDVRKLLAVLPPAKRGGGRGRDAKHPVRIGLPKLENEVSYTWIYCQEFWRGL